jgi:hypothetical protein
MCELVTPSRSGGNVVELKLCLFNISSPFWRLKLETCIETLKEVLGGTPRKAFAKPEPAAAPTKRGYAPQYRQLCHPFFPFCRGVFDTWEFGVTIQWRGRDGVCDVVVARAIQRLARFMKPSFCICIQLRLKMPKNKGKRKDDAAAAAAAGWLDDDAAAAGWLDDDGDGDRMSAAAAAAAAPAAPAAALAAVEGPEIMDSLLLQVQHC